MSKSGLDGYPKLCKSRRQAAGWTVVAAARGNRVVRQGDWKPFAGPGEMLGALRLESARRNAPICPPGTQVARGGRRGMIDRPRLPRRAAADKEVRHAIPRAVPPLA